MSMKVLPKGHKHQCPRQYQNYLVNNPKGKPKRPHTTRSHPSIHEHLMKQNRAKARPKSKHSKQQTNQKSQLEQLRRRNEEGTQRNSQLLQQLQEKSKRINQLKQRIKDYQLRVKEYEIRLKEYEVRGRELEVRARGYEEKIGQLQGIISESENPKSPISLDNPTQNLLTHYQHQLSTLETSQQSMMQHLQKYRAIEKEYLQYRGQAQRKIQRLGRQNERLRHLQPVGKGYEQEIGQLRRELTRIAEQSPPQHQGSHLFQNETIVLKTANKQLLTEREELVWRVGEQERREEELRGSLEAINRKVERWGEEYAKLTEEGRVLRERNQYLEQRIQAKREKHAREKEEWAAIFKELMREVERLKRQVARMDRPKTASQTNQY